MKKTNWVAVSKRAVLLSIGAQFAVLVFAALLGWAVSGEMIPLEMGMKAVPLGQVMLLFLAAYLGARTASNKKMLVALGVSCGIVFAQFVLRIMVFGGDVETISTDYLVFVIALIAGGLLACKAKKRRRI